MVRLGTSRPLGREDVPVLRRTNRCSEERRRGPGGGRGLLLLALLLAAALSLRAFVPLATLGWLLVGGGRLARRGGQRRLVPVLDDGLGHPRLAQQVAGAGDAYGLLV